MYRFFLATPEKVIYEGEVLSSHIPGEYGYFEVLTNHEPIIASLTAGKLMLTESSQKKLVWAVAGGVFEFSKNVATLLVDSLELPWEIDVKRAEEDLKNAEAIFAEKHPVVVHEQARMRVKKARNRLHIAEEYGTMQIKPEMPIGLI